MRKEVCTFGRQPHEFNKVKRSNDVERAPRPRGGGHQGGKPVKNDVTAPGISSISAVSVTSSSASISWTTSEEASCVLHYGLDTSYGSTVSSSAKTVHSVGLSGLTAESVYHFKVVATDLAGNITTSSDNTFSTIIVPSKVIYVELYGTTISGTLWNTSGSIVAGHSGFTETEIDALMIKLQAHFSDYNVLVTNDIDIYNATSYASKQRVVITESNEWYGSNAGGVAYINSWGWSDQAPAWVFSKLLSYNIHYCAEAAAHEIGHILGCRHQVTCNNGVITAEYNPGDGTIAPTMGVSYYVAAGDWWVGPSALGCTIIQDDNAIIVAKLGLKP